MQESASTVTAARAVSNLDVTPSVGEEVSLFVVYGLVLLFTGKVVYVGSTQRHNERACEHFNLVSGCRRVMIALSRKRFQPVLDHFEMRVLWMGECTTAQARAIEQHLMDRHDTRVHPRPTNGVTRDIDLIDREDPPEQLNIVRWWRS